MKILKLIVLMLITANLTIAQTVNHGVGSGSGGTNNVHYGKDAGKLVSGETNAYLGALAGKNATNGNNNVGIGYAALLKTNGANNTAIGFAAGINNDTGGDNVFMGAHTGKQNTSGSSNVYLGTTAGQSSTDGQGNVAIGRAAGNSVTTGNYNVFIGYHAGNTLTESNNKLYIQSSSTADVTTPLIYGDFASKQVGIGTSYIPTDPDTNTPYTLAINGKAIAEEIQIMTRDTWPDYVFAEDYELLSLTELEEEIETLGHLPGVPSAEEVEENGHALGEMDAILLEKVEELTLHLIELNKEVKALQEENTTLKNEVQTLKKTDNKKRKK